MPRPITVTALLLVLIAAPFALYSAAFGLRGLTSDLAAETRLYTTPGPNLAIFTHMIAGALITALAPLQLIPSLRARYPQLHRRLGYTLLTAAALTGLTGLIYIALRGTIGGPLMSAGFALYGVLLLVAAANTVYHAIDKATLRHRAWALRLTVLAVGSFLYRLLYGLWYWATDGLASNEAFTGLFDQLMFVGFYLPFLAALELYLRWEARR
ncbi:Predicted membrane protein [Roseivivax lentus]|uniref:Predicted membrane protein n=1 Tax=Roseivivax lentus TaxID=633194 RepID=A0A1N7L259_9RHOB|nr:DUF2306 domain-containing protein [Roseivivax lentus]SIS67945.1 Predicted membrane protein [Roseivivax lentus]